MNTYSANTVASNAGAATRQQILSAGYTLIARKGFSAVGLSQILASAGVPKGSFYHYFKSKEHFGEELINSYFIDYQHSLNALLDPSAGSGYQCLMSYWQRWLRTQATQCEDNKCLVVKLGAEVADLSEPMRLALMKGADWVVDRLAKCIERGIVDGSIVNMDAPLVAQALYSQWLGASLLAKLNGNDLALQGAMRATESLLGNHQLS